MRAFGVLLLAFAAPPLIRFLLRVLTTEEVRSLARGHQDAFIGALTTFLWAAREQADADLLALAPACAAGVYLLRLRRGRVLHLVRRLEQT